VLAVAEGIPGAADERSQCLSRLMPDYCMSRQSELVSAQDPLPMLSSDPNKMHIHVRGENMLAREQRK
jgi:hypothetical protein